MPSPPQLKGFSQIGKSTDRLQLMFLGAQNHIRPIQLERQGGEWRVTAISIP